MRLVDYVKLKNCTLEAHCSYFSVCNCRCDIGIIDLLSYSRVKQDNEARVFDGNTNLMYINALY